MAWSFHTWKILRIFQSQFLSGEVRAKTRHSSYTSTLPLILRMKNLIIICLLISSVTACNSQQKNNKEKDQEMFNILKKKNRIRKKYYLTQITTNFLTMTQSKECRLQ